MNNGYGNRLILNLSEFDNVSFANGPLEGNVNRLKLIKRSMYARAEFDLLKLRVLYHRKKRQPTKNKESQRRQEEHLKKPGSGENGTISQHTTFPISKVA